MQPECQQRATELVDAGRLLYSLGMVPATSGNFSARFPDNNMAITVSGRHKGRLTAAEIGLHAEQVLFLSDVAAELDAAAAAGMQTCALLAICLR